MLCSLFGRDCNCDFIKANRSRQAGSICFPVKNKNKNGSPEHVLNC